MYRLLQQMPTRLTYSEHLTSDQAHGTVGVSVKKGRTKKKKKTTEMMRLRSCACHRLNPKPPNHCVLRLASPLHQTNRFTARHSAEFRAVVWLKGV